MHINIRLEGHASSLILVSFQWIEAVFIAFVPSVEPVKPIELMANKYTKSMPSLPGILKIPYHGKE